MVVFSYCKRDIFDALNDRDESTFYAKLVVYFAILVIAVPITVMYDFWKRSLALNWREALSKKMIDKYYENKTFFILETTRDIDNPDQRISEDIASFTAVSLTFCFIIINALISLAAFSVVLFQIYPYLFLAIIAYAVLGTFITARLGRSLVGLYFSKLQKEADFRFGLIRTRENAEVPGIKTQTCAHTYSHSHSFSLSLSHTHTHTHTYTRSRPRRLLRSMIPSQRQRRILSGNCSKL